jgi:dihydrodipicolinate synthase/N-acetylneuraminate lyase
MGTAAILTGRKKMTNWRGVFPAVTTKLRQDGSIDLKATQASLDRLIVNGVSGVIVLPMLGENASLDPAEREQVIRAAKEVVAGRVPLLSGLAAISTEDATASARRFESFGAEGLMVFPSLAYKTDPRETAAWYNDLQQPHRLWRRCDAGDPRRSRRHAGHRLHQGGERRHPPRHRPL